MIDTLDLVLRQYEYPEVSFLEEVPQYLTTVISDGINYNTNSRKVVGLYKNYTITITSKRICINKGSLCKYVHGDNVAHILSREDIKNAINDLSLVLNLPINKASVCRVDIGANIQVDNPIATYLNRFSKYKYTQPSTMKHGINFKATNIELAFYDKNKEANTKQQYPYLLRYEIRIHNPKKIFKKLLLAEDLYNPQIYDKLVNTWLDCFCHIKLKPTNNHSPTYNDVKDLTALRNYCFDRVIAEYYEEIISQIEIAHSKNILSSRNYFNILDRISKASQIIAPDYIDPIIELKEKVEQIAYNNLSERTPYLLK